MWFKVDDSFHSHPKAMAVSLAALGLWTVAGSWSGDHLTDGFVPDHMVAALARGQAQLVDELINAGLWKRTKGGYRFHQWDERNPTKSVAIASAEKKASGGALGNHLRWHVKKGVQKADCRYCQEKQASHMRSDMRSVTDRSSESHPNPDPTRPEKNKKPSPPDGFEEFWDSYPPRKNSSKADAVRAYAKALKEGADPAHITDAARSYAADRAGKDQQYTAHAATWLNGRRWENQPEQQPARPRSLWDN